MLDIAKRDDIDEEVEELISMVLFKAEANIKTVSPSYLKADCEQAVECMLPLPRWCHEEELKAQLQEQEYTDPETIFGNKKIYCELN